MSLSDDLHHEHVYLGDNHDRNERKVWAVIALTMLMMLAEIVAGNIYGSMALVADGWHMSTHAGAMLIAALAYGFARRQARNPRFTFGTGKVGDLAGFASAVILALIALLIAWESAIRLASPVAIDFDQAVAVAMIGLVVNIACALLLRDEPHHHGHDHDHGSHAHQDHASHDHGDHDHGGHGHHAAHTARVTHAGKDHNLRAAYLHVIADALTSVLAIVALLLGKWNGWTFLDPVMGIVGGLVIARWSWGLLRVTGGVLVDALPAHETLPRRIRQTLETGSDRITDLHVWQVGPGHHAAIVAIATPDPQMPAFYKEKLGSFRDLSHVTVEVTGTASVISVI